MDFLTLLGDVIDKTNLLEWMAVLRVQWFTLALFLIFLTFASRIIAQFRWYHRIAAFMIGMSATLYMVRDMLFSAWCKTIGFDLSNLPPDLDFMSQLQGILAMLMVPVFIRGVIVVMRVNEERRQVVDEMCDTLHAYDDPKLDEICARVRGLFDADGRR